MLSSSRPGIPPSCVQRFWTMPLNSALISEVSIYGVQLFAPTLSSPTCTPKVRKEGYPDPSQTVWQKREGTIDLMSSVVLPFGTATLPPCSDNPGYCSMARLIYTWLIRMAYFQLGSFLIGLNSNRISFLNEPCVLLQVTLATSWHPSRTVLSFGTG